MEFNLHLISNIPLFRGIALEDLSVFLHCLQAKSKTYTKGEIIFHIGEPVQYVGIVLSGCVHLIKEDRFGNRAMFSHIPSLEIFGESFAYSDTARLPVSAVAAQNSEIMLIDRKKLHTTCHNVCDFHQRLIRNLLGIIAQNNVLLNQKLEITSKRTTREKIMAYLFYEAEKNKTDAFTIPFDRQALADYLGVERSGLSAEISKLHKEGKIEVHRNHFRILLPHSPSFSG